MIKMSTHAQVPLMLVSLGCGSLLTLRTDVDGTPMLHVEVNSDWLQIPRHGDITAC
jgi:hypothetical protein